MLEGSVLRWSPPWASFARSGPTPETMTSAMDSTSAEGVVARQLAAYNARDIDGFMSVWAPEAEQFEHPATALARGAAEIRARYVRRFQEPGLAARLVSRMAVGGLVVDQEIVRLPGIDGVWEFDLIAIYEVREGLIQRAWYRQGEPRPAP